MKSCPTQTISRSKSNLGREERSKSIFLGQRWMTQTTLSQEDRSFLEIMETKIHKNQCGNWEMPLPFRSSNIAMPNNRSLAVNRLYSLLRTFKKKPQMKEDYLQFMGNVLNRGHAVPVAQEELSAPSSPPEMNGPNDRGLPNQEQTIKIRNEGRIWYLPHFGVYHPRKPDQIRVVFELKGFH